MVPIADLIPYIHNPRQHSAEKIAQLAASMKEFVPPAAHHPLVVTVSLTAAMGIAQAEGWKRIAPESI